MTLSAQQMNRNLSLVRSDFPILSRLIHGKHPLVFFDNAASTQRPSQVIAAMTRLYEHDYANVHRGVHELSQSSSDLYEQARSKVASFINAFSDKEVVFTSGTTSAINLVARSWGEASVGADDEILLTEMEHHSNIVPWQQLAQRTGATVKFLPISDDGQLKLDRLSEYLTSRTKVVALTALSNVLGTIVPVKQIVAQVKSSGAVVVVDAAQYTPHSETDVRDWGADFVAFSGHKMLGPTGIGVLWGRAQLLEQMPPFLGGGSMIHTVTQHGFEPSKPPAKFEAGTPPIAEAIGLAAAIDYLNELGMPAIFQHEHQLACQAYELMQEIPRVRILGPPPDQRAGIVSFVVEGANAQDVSTFLDLKGFATRAGHHCAMPLHQRLGVPSSCRASFYLYNTSAEVESFVQTLRDVIDKVG